MSPLQLCLLFSSVLFSIGLIGALSRSNTILVLLGIELMLNAANINFIAFWRFSPSPSPATGVLFGAVMATRLDVMPGPAPSVSVLDLGQQLMGPHVAALLVIGALLTVALLGAIVIASHDRDEKPEDTP